MRKPIAKHMVTSSRDTVKDVFAAAPTIKTTKKAKKADKPSMLVVGLRKYAALDFLVKTCSDLQKLEGAKIRSTMVKFFAAHHSKESIDAYEGDTTASLQCRSNPWPIKEEAVDLLEDFDIPLETMVTYSINPEYADDPAMRRKFNAAMAKSGLPDDFILKTEEKKFLRAEGMEAILELPPSTSEKLIPNAFTLAVLPHFDGDIAEALDIADGILLEPKPKLRLVR